MSWFTRRKAIQGQYRVTAITEKPSYTTMTTNGMPMRSIEITEQRVTPAIC
jgi:hypothetical protein